MMNSGVYQLTFPSGHTYIGKSINMPERWKQHYSKMSKGTAALNMQAEFDRFKQFSSKILLVCHPDHIDLLEAYCISTLEPTLNCSRPENPYPHLSWEDLERLLPLFQLSTWEHLIKIGELSSLTDNQENELEELEEECHLLHKRRSVEEIDRDVRGRIMSLEEELEEEVEETERIATKYEQLKKDFTSYKQRSWWQRLFT